MATNNYGWSSAAGRSAPGHDCPRITPDDNNDLATVAKALRVFNTNAAVRSIAFRTGGGGENVRTWKLSPGQNIIPVVVTRVMTTGTDDADLEIDAIVD